MRRLAAAGVVATFVIAGCSPGGSEQAVTTVREMHTVTETVTVTAAPAEVTVTETATATVTVDAAAPSPTEREIPDVMYRAALQAVWDEWDEDTKAQGCEMWRDFPALTMSLLMSEEENVFPERFFREHFDEVCQ